MSTDTFDITKLSRAYDRAPWLYGLLSAVIEDNGVFVNGEKSNEDRNYSKAGC